jgi:hypothetical protein
MNSYETQAAKDHLKLQAYKIMYLAFELASGPDAEEIIQELEERVKNK